MRVLVFYIFIYFLRAIDLVEQHQNFEIGVKQYTNDFNRDKREEATWSEVPLLLDENNVPQARLAYLAQCQ